MADVQDTVNEAQAEFGDHIIMGSDGQRDKQAEWDALEAEIEKLPEDHWLRDPETLEAYRQHVMRDLNPEEQALFDEFMRQHEVELSARDIEALKDFCKSSTFHRTSEVKVGPRPTIDEIREMQSNIPQSDRDALDQENLYQRLNVGSVNDLETAEELAQQYDIHNGIDAPTGRVDMGMLDYERVKARIAELNPGKNVQIDRSDISESQFRNAKMLALKDAGLDLKTVADANLSTEELVDLANQYDTGKLEAGEVKALFNKMAGGQGAELGFDPNNPVASLNQATVDGRLPEGSSWEIADGGEALGQHAKITIDDPAKLEDIRNALNAAGITTFQTQPPNEGTLIIPEDQLAEIEDLGQVLDQLDVTLPKGQVEVSQVDISQQVVENTAGVLAP